MPEATAPEIWLTDSHGNRCSASYFGSAAAARRALDSLMGCRDCTNFSDCVDCTRCVGCVSCRECLDCDCLAYAANKASVDKLSEREYYPILWPRRLMAVLGRLPAAVGRLIGRVWP